MPRAELGTALPTRQEVNMRRNSKFSSPLAAVQPLTIHSWAVALDVSGSRRVCRMAISNNACPLIVLIVPGLLGDGFKLRPW